MRHAGEIVKNAMEAKGMTQLELARRIGKDQTLISRLFSGQPVSDATALSMAEVLELDYEELRHQLQRDRLERKKKKLGTEYKEVLDEDEQRNIFHSEIAIIGRTEVEDIPNVSVVPMVDSIPVNLGKQLREKSQPYIIPSWVELDIDKSFALKVSGENMTDDKIDEGDIIVVDTNSKIEDGKYVLAMLNDMPILTKIYRSGEAIVLQSQKGAKDQIIFVSQKDNFKIIGRVVLCNKYF